MGFRRLGVAQATRAVLAAQWAGRPARLVRLNYLGAVYVPVTSPTGRHLEHIVDNADARLIVSHAQLLPRLASIRRAKLADAVVIGGAAEVVEGLRSTGRRSPGRTVPCRRSREVAPWDTPVDHLHVRHDGALEGCHVLYLQLYSMGVESLFFAGPDDRCMVNLPLFHVGGTAAVPRCWRRAARSPWSTPSTRRASGRPFARRARPPILLGVMAGFLAKQAPRRRIGAPAAHAIMVPLERGRHRALLAALRLRHLHPVQHVRGVGAAGVGGQSRASSAAAVGRAPASEVRIVDDARLASRLRARSAS